MVAIKTGKNIYLVDIAKIESAELNQDNREITVNFMGNSSLIMSFTTDTLFESGALQLGCSISDLNVENEDNVSDVTVYQKSKDNYDIYVGRFYKMSVDSLDDVMSYLTELSKSGRLKVSYFPL